MSNKSAEALIARPAVELARSSVACKHVEAGTEYPVRLGASLRRRSTETLTLRYSFRPGSCHIRKSGKLKLQKRDESAEVQIDNTTFHGKANAAKVSEFVLIRDKNGWRLERLAMSIKNLNPTNR